MIQILKELWWFIKKKIFWYILAIILGAVVMFGVLEITNQLGDFSQMVEDQINQTATITKDAVIHITINICLLAIMIYVAVVTKRLIYSKLMIMLYYDLREKYLLELLSQDADFFSHFDTGDLIARASGDIMRVRGAAVQSYLDIIIDIIDVVLVFLYATSISWKLTLYSIIPLPLLWLVTNVLAPKIRKNWKQVRKKVSKFDSDVLEDVSNVKVIRSYAKEDLFAENLKESSMDLYKTEKKNLYINSLFSPLYTSISIISTVIALSVGAYFLFRGEPGLTATSLAVFTLYLSRLINPLMDIGLTINVFNQSLISLERLNEIFHAPHMVEEKENAIPCDTIHSIEFANLGFQYPGNTSFKSLEDVSFTLKEGQTLGVVGRTGGGKTSLIRTLTRQYPITEGKVLINGISIEEYTKESVREHLSIVPQEHILFTRSVRDNIRLGTKNPTTDADIDRVVELADFTKDVDSLADGLDTVVGEYGVTLSGGQKQRVSIARAFLKDSDVLILDDSLSAVDGETEEKIIHNIQETRKGRTNIIIAHRLSAVMNADLILVFSKGRIIERGTHKELMDLHGWYYEQYMTQQLGSDSHA